MINKKFTIAAIAAAAITTAPIVAPAIGAITTLPVAAATTSKAAQKRTSYIEGDSNDYGKRTVTIAAIHGARVYTAPGGKKTSRVLPESSRWTSYEFTTSDSPIASEWVNLGGHQWISANDIDNAQPYKHIVKIHYVPGYSIAVWDTPVSGSNKPTGKLLKNGTSWKTFEFFTDDTGTTWFSVGTNQWIQSKYAKVIK